MAGDGGRAPDVSERVQRPATAPAYVRFKDDGWPLCPGCGDDELWSPAVPATVDTIASCLNCNWRPGVPKEDRDA